MIIDDVSSWIRLILCSTVTLLEGFQMTVLDFTCGFLLFCKILTVLLQHILALSILKFEVQVLKTLSASPEVRDSTFYCSAYRKGTMNIHLVTVVKL